MPNDFPKNIVLIGMRGTGKSAVGRTLAEFLEWEMIDVDKLVEAEAGMTIAEIVATHDWPHFRALETAAVAKVAARKNVVISTGGGVVLNPDNIAALKENGVIVLLYSPLEHLASRVAKSDRPSLTGADPAAELERVWHERRALYAAAADTTVVFDFHTDNKKNDLLRKSKMVWKAAKDFLKDGERGSTI